MPAMVKHRAKGRTLYYNHCLDGRPIFRPKKTAQCFPPRQAAMIETQLRSMGFHCTTVRL